MCCWRSRLSNPPVDILDCGFLIVESLVIGDSGLEIAGLSVTRPAPTFPTPISNKSQNDRSTINNDSPIEDPRIKNQITGLAAPSSTVAAIDRVDTVDEDVALSVWSIWCL
jgi:hypothetical protein